jgi:transcription initiation factor TFIIIB Brf1 subunit/transcription initiation factor TFIIB
MTSFCTICNHRNILKNPYINKILCSSCGKIYKIPTIPGKKQQKQIKNENLS